MFPKVGQVKECQDNGTFLFAKEKIGIGGAIRVSMDVPQIWWICMSMKLKVLCFKNEIEDCANYMETWAVCGQEMLLFLLEIITITLKQTKAHCIQTETFLLLALQSFIATIQRNWDTIVNVATVATVSILLSRL